MKRTLLLMTLLFLVWTAGFTSAYALQTVDKDYAIEIAEREFSYAYDVSSQDIVVLDVGAYHSKYNDDGWWIVKLGDEGLSARETYAVSQSDGQISQGWEDVEIHEQTLARQAGKIHPLLQEQTEQMAPMEKVTVIVVLKKQPNIRKLLKKAKKLARKEARERRMEGEDAEQEKGETGKPYLLKLAAKYNRKHGQPGIRRFIKKKLKGDILSVGYLRNHIVARVPVGDLSRLAKLRRVREIQPDLLNEGHLENSVPSVGITDFVRNHFTRGDDNPHFPIDIGIMDSGIDWRHSALDVFRSRNFDAREPDSNDDRQGHGTRVAGCSSSQDPTFTGVAPDSRLWNLKVAHQTADGRGGSSSSTIEPSLRFSYVNHLEVVNRSYGSAPDNHEEYMRYHDGSLEACKTFDAYVEAGLIVTATAGNVGPDMYKISRPNDAFNVITVGGMSLQGDDMDRSNDFLAERSSRGPTADSRTKPDIVAPGWRIDMPSHRHETGDDWISRGGTSYAAPHVAGVAALVIDHWADQYGERLAGADTLGPGGRGLFAKIDGGPLLVRSLLYVGADESYGRFTDTAKDDYFTGTGYMDGLSTLQLTDKSFTWVTNISERQTRRRFVLGRIYPEGFEPPLVKAAVTWDRHVDVDSLTPLGVSDIDLELRDVTGTLLQSSSDSVTNWEKVRGEETNPDMPGVYRIDIVGNSVPPEVGTETVALATNSYILPPWPNRSFNKDVFIDAIVGRRMGDGTYTWDVAQGDSTGFAERSEWATGFGAGQVYVTGDFDGGGFTDLAWAVKHPTINGFVVDWTVAVSNGVGFNDPTIWGSELFTWSDTSGSGIVHFFAGDFNGDGSTDIVTAQVVDDTTVRWYVSESVAPTGGPNFLRRSTWISDFGDNGDKFLVGDFNGDGMADIGAVHEEHPGRLSVLVATSDGTSFMDQGVWKTETADLDHEFFTGDFTGDGLTDLAYTSEIGTDIVVWRVAESYETEFGPTTLWSSDFGDPGDEFLVGDFTGDGWTDFACVETLDGRYLRWRVGKSTDRGISGTSNWGRFGEVGDIIVR